MKNFFLLIATLFSPVLCEAQEISFLEEGKQWTYYSNNMMEQYRHNYNYVLHGDTVVLDRKCMKLFRDDKLTAFLYEDGCKVYCSFPEEKSFSLLYDFGLNKGDEITALYGKKIRVMKTEERDYCGVNRRLLWWLPCSEYENMSADDMEKLIADGREELFGQWIEGVGSPRDMFAYEPYPGNNSSLVCKQAGRQLFPDESFVDEIDRLHETAVSTLGLYDLTGRRLTAEPARGIYIRDGKKMMRR